MIRPFDADGHLVPLTYNGYTLNTVTRTEEGEGGSRIFAVAHRTAVDYISEKRQWADGIEVYGITKGSRILQVSGGLHGIDVGDLMDRCEALAHAFDPSDIAYNNTDPFLPLTWTAPQTTPVPSKMFVVPVVMPEPILMNAKQGWGAAFNLTLLAKDPRRYAQTAVSRSNAGTLSNPDANYRSWPTITFTMSGAGSATFTVGNTSTREGATSIVFDLSGRSNGQAITLDFAQRRVLVGTTVTAGIFVSGTWFNIEPGNNAITYTNTTNVGTRTITAYPAFSW